ncbi:MAG: bifunctional phosphopantothenoylcysteine decarboxylase/phosphopantothenate--cysteine ligase CoaBC [Bdellovibrionales bacterium]|nr:bifunctional phosphopantothenoylcysteine decarboxylase/phosphopantothenate--cysteine ligase CoaBC [Bdellovibrionales bacterium]
MNKRVLFLMSGSIASYKACQVLSRLKQLGHEVEVVASPWSLRFVGEATIEGLTGRPVHQSMFGSGAHMSHIHLVRWADVVIVCPATANTINKLAHGIGDDLLTTLFLAHDFSKPWLIAPAMNTKMYHHPATRESVKRLAGMGCKILETASGVLACGEIGDGKLLDPELLLKEILSELSLTKPRVESSDSAPASSRVPGAQKRVLITSGGTSVPIDRVRSITNHSTGKTGAALCEVFAGLGYAVTLLAAKSAVKPRLDEFNQIKSQTIEFETFSELQKSLEDCLVETEFDIVIHAAAVSDYSLADGPKDGKVDSSDEVVLRLKKNPKLLDSIRKKSKNPRVKVVGFKFTAGDADRQARAIKIAESGAVDFLVTNDLSTYPNWEFHSIDQINRSLNLVDTGSDRHELGILISQKVTT